MNSKADKAPVLVVAHDAGSAEIVAAYVRAHTRAQRFDVYAAGPALKIFRREGVAARSLTRADLKKVVAAHRGGAALLGTGHPKSLELAALKEAKRQGLRTASCLDSWKRYRERFGYPSRDWKKDLPDQIWAGDTIAYALAKKYFPARIVRYTPNMYFKNVRARVKTTRRRGNAVLFLSVADKISFTLLEAVLAAFKGRKHAPEIIVRLHPLDDRKRFEKLIRSSHARAVLSGSDDIADDIGKARVAIGGETTALAVAAYSGIPAVCLWRGEVPLPFKKMKRAPSVRGAVRALERTLRV